jgi:hypothetical protein
LLFFSAESALFTAIFSSAYPTRDNLYRLPTPFTLNLNTFFGVVANFLMMFKHMARVALSNKVVDVIIALRKLARSIFMMYVKPFRRSARYTFKPITFKN